MPRLLAIILMILLSALSGFVIYKTLECQYKLTQQNYKKLSNHQDSISKHNSFLYHLTHELGISSIVGTITILMNVFTQNMFTSISGCERQSTKTDKAIASTRKVSFFNILNYVVFPRLISMFIYKNKNSSQSSGLIYNQSTMIVLDIILINIIHLINPSYQANRLYRAIFRNMKYVTQKYAHDLYTEPRFKIGVSYGIVINWIVKAMTNAGIIPLITPVVAIGVFIFYWINKYNLLRRNRISD